LFSKNKLIFSSRKSSKYVFKKKVVTACSNKSAKLEQQKEVKYAENMKICSWNIRRGLIKRELELKDMLNSEKLNIMFLVETDTKLPNGKSDYKIEGYATVLQKTNQVNDKIRIIGLVEEDTFKYTKIREDLMSTEFPTIWLEIIRTNYKNLLVCGWYREWTRNDDSTEAGQSQRLKI
jgi:hypothetical protein